MPPSLPAPRPIRTRCRICAVALTLQQARGDHLCARHGHRPDPGEPPPHAERDEALAARRASAARRWKDDTVAQAPVVWITPHRAKLVPLPRQRRLAHREHLSALAAELAAHPHASPPEADATASHDAPLAASLCTFCAGRCCRWGAGTQAFITVKLLRRWLDQHPDRTPHEAAAAYAALLPRHHVQDSCVHHGSQGCTLPREMRSDICNQYVCDGLRRLQDHDDAGRHSALLAATGNAYALHDAALLRPEGHRRLPKLPAARKP